jgi:hypothetical protein
MKRNEETQDSIGSSNEAIKVHHGDLLIAAPHKIPQALIDYYIIN